MGIIEDFRARVEAALERHEIAPSTFGADALNDPRFVFDLRGGERSFHSKTIEKVDSHIAKLDAARAKTKKARVA